MFINTQFPMICRDDLEQCLLDSARNVFRVMANIALKECHDQPVEQQDGGVTALVGFEGAFSGLVALHCPEQLARRTSAILLCAGEEVAAHDVCDAMGEVVNILSGDIKLYLDRGGRQVRLSTPSVFESDADFHEEFLAAPGTVACTMYAGEERLMIGVKVCYGES